MADPIDPLDSAVEEMARERANPDAGVVGQPKLKVVQPNEPAPDALDVAADKMLDERQAVDKTDARLLEWRAKNDNTDPGKRADVLRYSAASGLKPDFVEQNLDTVKQSVDGSKVDWNTVAYQHPELVQWMLEQPAVTPLVKDDLDNMGILKWSLVAPYYAFGGAVQEQRTIFKQFRESSGAGSKENRDEIAQLDAEYGNRTYGAHNFLTKGWVGIGKVVPYIAGDLGSRVAGAYFGGILGSQLGGTAGAAGGGAATVEAGGEGAVPGGVAGAEVGGGTGAAVGSFVGSGLFNYYQNVGPMYWRLSNLKDANGEPMDPSTARAFAQGGAVLTGGLMSGFMGKYAAQLPGVKQLLANMGVQTVEAALADRTVNQAVKDGALKYGQHWLTGATMMAGQSALSAATEEAAKSASPNFEGEWGNVASAAGEGFKSGLEDMWLVSALGPGRELLTNIGRARASAESAAKLSEALSAAGESKLLERSPEVFRQAVQRMKDQGEAIKNVYVPVDDWTNYWQGKKLDPAEVASAVVGDGGKAFTEAATTKGDIAIPVENFLSKFAKNEHGEALLMDAKVHPDELTPRQFQAEEKSRTEKLEQEAKVRGSELEAGKREVNTFIKEQAIAAGTPKAEAESVAKLISEFAGNIAVRAGISVQEAAATGALGRLRILGPKGEAVARAARERFQTFLRPTASRLLEQRLASMSTEARANEYFLDSVSGLRNRRAFDVTPVPEGKQVATITSPDVKGINDHPTAGGHGVANELLRAIGKSVGEGHEEAARSGTNFLLHVKDQAELDQVVQRVKASLGNDQVNVLGALGNDTKPLEDQLRAEKKLPPRGELNAGLDVAGLKAPAGRAEGTVPTNLVHELGGLSDVDYARKAYLDTVKVGGKEVQTGLLTREGWEGIPRKAHVASLDAKGLKAANEKYGKEAGNLILQAIGRALSHFGGSGFDAAHLSGDEFAAQHNDPLELERFVNRVKEEVNRSPLKVEDTATGKEEVVPVDFRHGIGTDYGLADRDLNARKRREAEVPLQAAGDHGVRGQPGAGVREDRQALREAGRGAQPQGFGREVVAHVEGFPVTFEQPPPDGEGARGTINLQLTPGGRPVSFDIQVLRGDRSTLLHETSHFLSWSLHELATSDLASPDIRKDYDALLKWMGYGSAGERLAETKERAQLAACRSAPRSRRPG
jgi:GGDEF domain-containing protein